MTSLSHSGAPRRGIRCRRGVVTMAACTVALAAAGTASADTTFLRAGTQVNPGQVVASPTTGFALAMQADGNLVMIAPGNRPVWSSGTHVKGTVLQVQSDGNVVLYAPGHNAVWSTGTGRNAGAVLGVQDDGNLVVIAPGNKPVWASGSGGLLGQTVSLSGPGLIRAFEGVRLTAYNDGAGNSGNCTIGIGHLLQYGPCTGANVGLTWTAAQVDAQFSADLVRFVNAVSTVYRDAGLQQNQFDALVSFAFNTGTGALSSPGLTSAVRSRSADAVAAQLYRYVYAKGKKSAGLCNRRRSEIRLWRTGQYVRMQGGCVSSSVAIQGN